MARDHEEGAQKEQQNTSGWLVPVDTTMGHTPVEHGTPGQSVQVMELEGEVDPGMKISKDYVVQLPTSDCDDEMILTPPLVPEDLPRLSKRNVQGMQEHVMAKAEKMASKKNLEGLQQGDDAKKLRAGAEQIRAGTMQLMKLCEAARQPITGE
ncbi:hypothetical protein ACQJBY_034996 [Aegilops geniculata]